MNINNILEDYKELICPHCTNYKNNFNDCNIVINIKGEADCINYKCEKYCKDKSCERKVKQNTIK